MKGVINGLFSKKFYSIERKRELKRMIIIEKELKKKFDNEERKRKIINKKTKTISKKINSKKIKENKITVTTPSIPELELLLEKSTDKYDFLIKKSRKLHSDLIFLGLTDSGLKEHVGESIKQRQKRIKKINKIHSELIKVLEENKNLEKNIEIIHKKLNERIDILRK